MGNEVENICKSIFYDLENHKSELISLFAEESHYNIEDIERLWIDLSEYINKFPIFYENKLNNWKNEEGFYNQWRPGTSFLHLPWGKVLICISSNSVIPLLPIFILSFCCLSNSVVISPSRRTMKTAERIFNIIKNNSEVKLWNIFLFKEGGQAAIAKYVSNRDVDLLFFQGSSKNRNEIYQKCIENSVDIIFEGEGNPIVFIDFKKSNQALSNLLSDFFRYNLFCNGQLCTTPRFIFCKKENLNNISGISEVVLEDIESFNFDSENSGLKIYYFSNINQLHRVLKENKFGLQISIFSDHNELEVFVLRYGKVGRITVNRNPLDQNSLLPWGGYKISGYSKVSDFLEKATKTVIVEK